LSVIEINRDPSEKDLRVFGMLLALFCGLVGGIAFWRITEPSVAYGIWGIGAVLVTLYLLLPVLRKPLYLGWMYLAYPIGWTVSHLVLGATYYLLITPVGILLRLFRYDSMSRRFDDQADSYWKPRETNIDSSRYFKQF
jgi:hypothetical protein